MTVIKRTWVWDRLFVMILYKSGNILNQSIKLKITHKKDRIWLQTGLLLAYYNLLRDN
jgi:hypothetical protein